MYYGTCWLVHVNYIPVYTALSSSANRCLKRLFVPTKFFLKIWTYQPKAMGVFPCFVAISSLCRGLFDRAAPPLPGSITGRLKIAEALLISVVSRFAAPLQIFQAQSPDPAKKGPRIAPGPLALNCMSALIGASETMQQDWICPSKGPRRFRSATPGIQSRLRFSAAVRQAGWLC